MKILQMLTYLLDLIYKVFILLAKASEKFANRLFYAISNVGQRLLSLIWELVKLGYYVAPFALMITIGRFKEWYVLELIGEIFVILMCLVFLYYLVVSLQGNEVKENTEPAPPKGVNIGLGITTFLLTTYSFFYFILNISPEKQIAVLFKKESEHSKINMLREKNYLNIINDSLYIDDVKYRKAILELGNLKSKMSVIPLLNGLHSMDLTSELTDSNTLSMANLIVDALVKIDADTSCEVLVRIETNALNENIKEIVRVAAFKICKD